MQIKQEKNTIQFISIIKTLSNIKTHQKIKTSKQKTLYKC